MRTKLEALLHPSHGTRDRLARCWRISTVAAALALMAAGCSSTPTYPKQIITVLPGTEGTASQYMGPGVGPSVQPPTTGENAPAPGTTRPEVPASGGTGALP